MMRLVQRPPTKPTGLAIAFLVGNQVDAKLRDALPGWAIVATAEAPLSVTSDDIQVARKLAKVDANIPIGLIGFSAGCQSVRTILLANLIKVDLVFVAVFDGTHGAVPPIAWQIQPWRICADEARAGRRKFLATCTSMTYTKTIRVGQPGRATPTREILEAVLETTLEINVPVIDGGLYVERFPSSACDKEAHIRQENEVLPALLKRWIGGIVETVEDVTPDTLPAWRRPDLKFRDRVLAWCQNELDKGVAEEPKGSNDSPRIREYFTVPGFQRDGKPIHVTKTKWCAASACMAWHECYLPDVDRPPPQARVSGIELERDARESGRFYTGEAQPGDLAIFKRGTEDWERHVTHVLSWDGDSFHTIAGNENDGWAISTHAKDDPTLVGYIQVQ